MDRILFSGASSCSSGCAYCFAKWRTLYPQPPHLSLRYIDNTRAIIYPCCDSELFLQTNVLPDLYAVADKLEELYISVSMKHVLHHHQLDQLLKLDGYLRETCKGFIKISVSFSTKYMINQLEPATLPYDDRISLLRDLSESNVNSVVIIKPMLPFIPISEYFEIVGDTALVGKYLLGDLYVDPQSKFYSDFIEGKFGIHHRNVGWLPQGTCWQVVDQETRRIELENHITLGGASFYSSDVEAIASFF